MGKHADGNRARRATRICHRPHGHLHCHHVRRSLHRIDVCVPKAPQGEAGRLLACSRRIRRQRWRPRRKRQQHVNARFRPHRTTTVTIGDDGCASNPPSLHLPILTGTRARAHTLYTRICIFYHTHTHARTHARTHTHTHTHTPSKNAVTPRFRLYCVPC